MTKVLTHLVKCTIGFFRVFGQRVKKLRTLVITATGVRHKIKLVFLTLVWGLITALQLYVPGTSVKKRLGLMQRKILTVSCRGLIEAYQKPDTKIELVLIGAKHPAYHYEGTADILVIENAPYKMVAEAYQRCRFAVFPSIWPEPFGLVNLEAMSYKKAVIASNIGGFTDVVVDGETGILVPPGDGEALSQAIKYLLENPDVVEEMGQEGYKRWKENFTPEVVVPKIEELYQSLK